MGLVASCGSKQHFSVEGSLADDQFNGKTVYLYQNGSVVDSAVVADGRFAFSGEASQPWLASLAAAGESVRAQLDFIVEPGKLNLDLLAGTVSGSPLNDSLQAFANVNDYSEFEADMRTYEQIYYSTTDARERADAERIYDSLEAIGVGRTFERAKALYLANKSNALGAYAMSVMAGTDRLTFADMTALLDGACPQVTDNAKVQARLSQLKAVEETSVGRHYTDIVGVDGRLSDLVEGRVALVDFYASWCPPCRAEIKDNLVPLWAKYKDRGLVIVGLNVWERGDRAKREAAHQKVMADLGITYPQLVDSTSVATDVYGVRGIPQILLIGKDGTILARDLRGAAIEEAIVNALAQ